MKALRLHAPGDLRLHDEPRPIPHAGESLLRVAAVGLCGSDLHWFNESGIGDARLVHPLVLGHELAAVVQADGRLVAVDPAIPCGVCEHCLAGASNLCPQIIFAGHGSQDGGLRQELSWPEKHLFDLPESMDAIDGAMLEPLGIAIHSLNLAQMQVGMQVGVFGCGPIGLLILQLVRLAGAGRIVATDRLVHRVEAACELGAGLAMQVGADGFLAEQQKAVGERGLDVVFEAAGENPAVESAIEAAKPGGRVVLVGIPSDDRTSFSASVARRKGLSILVCRRMKQTYPRAIQLVKSRKVDVRSLVTHRFPLESAQEAFQTAANRAGLKVIIEP
jgi:L-iditol 2-dehydrogenase